MEAMAVWVGLLLDQLAEPGAQVLALLALLMVEVEPVGAILREVGEHQVVFSLHTVALKHCHLLQRWPHRHQHVLLMAAVP